MFLLLVGRDTGVYVDLMRPYNERPLKTTMYNNAKQTTEQDDEYQKRKLIGGHQRAPKILEWKSILYRIYYIQNLFPSSLDPEIIVSIYMSDSCRSVMKLILILSDDSVKWLLHHGKLITRPMKYQYTSILVRLPHFSLFVVYFSSCDVLTCMHANILNKHAL